jgi:hypothetical protein
MFTLNAEDHTYKQDQGSFVSAHLRMFDLFGAVVARLLTDYVSGHIFRQHLRWIGSSIHRHPLLSR